MEKNTNKTVQAVKDTARSAKNASRILAKLDAKTKNEILKDAADFLRQDTPEILAANQADLALAKASGMPEALQDRLALSKERIEGMAASLEQIADLADPIGEVDHMDKRPNGLLIGQKRVPLGVCAVIYEARPNVTSDVFGLCFKTGNASILKGGKEAAQSNAAIAKSLSKALEKAGLPKGSFTLMSDNSREASSALMRCNEYVDVLIPRGSARLINAVVQQATVPVIETGTGNCHAFVDESADQDMALDIILNGKTTRVGVCNALESIVVHKNIANEFLPELAKALAAKNVQMRAEKEWMPLLNTGEVIEANEEDWGTEYLDYIVSIKVVDDIDAAIDHVNTYSTGHSETIITRDYANAQRFLDEIDSAAVYVNASTRFTDGGEFGFGAEIGISTQKLHARGPMGLKALTSLKYIIYGSGQIR